MQTHIKQHSKNVGHFNPTEVSKKLTKTLENDIGLFLSELSRLSDVHLGEVLLELPIDAFTLALERVTPHKIAAAIGELGSDDATDLMQYIQSVSDPLYRKIMLLIKPHERDEIVELSKYDDEQTGAYMEKEFLAAKTQDSVATIKEMIRDFRNNEPTTPIIKLFVVDGNEKLLGSIHFADLLMFDDGKTVGDIGKEIGYRTPLSIKPETPITEAVRLFEEYDLNIVAVVDEEGKIIGRIVYDDIYDMIRQIEADQAYALAGVDVEAEESSLINATRQRLIWLLVNLITVLIASVVINQFHETISSYVALAALLPLTAALGGNAGMQALTVTIRKLAMGEIEYSNVTKTLTREVGIVLLNGLSIAFMASVIVYVWFGDYMLSAITAMAIFFTLIIAGGAGTMIPIALNKLGVDPAVASSVFLTTTTDIFGFFIFLYLAEYFLL